MNPLGFVFTALAYVVGATVYFRVSRSTGLEKSTLLLLMAAGLVGGGIGAKVVQVLVERGGPAALLMPGGRAIFAGIIAGWASVELVKRAIRLTRPTGDAFALALASGEILGRVGCHFNGCCFGKVCEAGWTVHQHGADRYPVQLYSAGMAALILGFLLWLRPRLPAPGMLFSAYLAVWAASRFGLELLREPQAQLGLFTLMQWVCLESIVMGVILFGLRLRQSRRPEAAA